MKISFLSYSLQGGGAERMVARLSNALISRGHEVSILLFSGTNKAYQLDERIKVYELEAVNLKHKISRWKKRIEFTKGCLRREKPDVLLAFMIGMVPFALLGCRGTECRVIGAERTNPHVLPRMYKMVIRFWAPFCDGYVFQTEGARQCYPAAVQKKGIVIPNIAPWIPDRTELPPDKYQICSAGRLSRAKDYSTLLYAFCKVKEQCPEAVLTIFGQGELKEELTALSEELKLRESVVFEDFVPNLTERLREFSVFAFSSKAEGMPNVLMEAMAAGLACVSTDCEFGPSEFIEDGRNGYLVPVGDALQMAERIVWLIQDDNLRKEFGREASKIRMECSEEKVVGMYLNYIEKVSKGKKYV